MRPTGPTFGRVESRPSTALAGPAGLLVALGILVATVLACEIGILALRTESWYIVPAWPPLGVSLAAFRIFGTRSWLPLLIGNSWIYLRLDPSVLWVLWILPPLYVIESWCAHILSKRAIWLEKTSRHSFVRMLHHQFFAPAIVAIPSSGIVAYSVYLIWQGGNVLPGENIIPYPFAMIWVLCFLAHILATCVISPMIECLLRGECASIFTFDRNGQPIAVILANFGVIMIFFGFSYKLSPPLTPQAVAMLPLPILFISAIWLNIGQVHVLSVFICLLAFVLTAFGLSPFHSSPGIITLGQAELGFYLLFIVIGLHTLSWVSSDYHRQIRHQNLAMHSAGMCSWHWHRKHGLAWENRPQAGEPSLPQFGIPNNLQLFPMTTSREYPDSWQHRTERVDPDGTLHYWDCFGRVLHRRADGTPEEMIGLVKDASSEEIARETQLKLDQQKAIMQGLQARLNPHFLFNSLNMIKALVRIDSAKAEAAIHNLSRMLRMTLKASERTLIPLADEITNIRALLEVAKMRFEDRITYHIRVPNLLDTAEVPVMLVFNQVENAITHGIAHSNGSGKVDISATRQDGNLVVRIRNTGKLDAGRPDGVGLGDARERLKLIYGASASIYLEQTSPAEVTCTISLPASASKSSLPSPVT